MTDPLRWIDSGSEADDFEREVLRSGGDLEIPAGAPDAVWRSLAGKLAPGDGTPDGGGSASPDGSAGEAALGALEHGASAALRKASLLGAVKGFVVGAGTGVLVMGGAILLSEEPEISRAPERGGEVSATSLPKRPGSEPAAAKVFEAAPSAMPAAERTPKTVEPPAAAPATASPAVASFPAQGSEAAEALAASRLREEAGMIREARAELRRGQLARSFAILEAARTRFPSPALGQEREALTIELLVRSGQTELARERARSFVERFPESPHARQFRGLVEAF